MPSKMKKAQKSIASDASLDRKEEHVSSEIKGKLDNSGSNGQGHSKLKTPCLIRTTQESRKSKENLDKKEKHVSSENKGRLGKGRSGRSGGEGDRDVKTLPKRNKKYEFGKSKGSLDRKGEHVSSENKGRLGKGRSGGEGDREKTLPKRNKNYEFRKSKGSLDRKGEHVSSKNEGRLGTCTSYGKGDPNPKMPSKIKKAHKSMESHGSLDKKDKHVSSEIKGKLCSSRVNGKGHSKTKMPCLLKKTQVFRMRKGKLDKKDEHVSSENIGKVGNSRSGGESDCNVKTLSTRNKRCESGKNHGSLDEKEEHVCVKNEGKLGNRRSDDEGDPNMKVLSKRKNQRRSQKRNHSLDEKDEHGSLENDDRVCNNNSHGEVDPNLKMPSTMKKTHTSIESDDGSLKIKDEHVFSEIDGKLGTNRINDESRTKMKVPCWIKKRQESRKSTENFDKMNEHVSSEKEDRHGKSRSGDEGVSERKERCKSRKSDGEHHVFSENEGRLGNIVGGDDGRMNLKKPVGDGTPGHWIGELFVSNTEITKGSNGTIVLEGSYEGQSVAVKHLDLADHDVASQEIESLIASDQDPNIVRLHGTERDQDFRYLALERYESGKNDGTLDKKEEHVSLKNERRLGNCKSDDEGDPNMKALSKRKNRRRSQKKNHSLDEKDEHGSLETDYRVCNDNSHGEVGPKLKMPSTMKKTHEAIESEGSLKIKDEHVYLEIDGKLGTNRINGENRTKMKVPCWIKKTQESRKSTENIKMNGRVSSENEDWRGKSRSGDEGVSDRKERCESGKSDGEHHVFSEKEGRLGNTVGDDGEMMNLEKPVGGGTPGHWIGKLFVSDTEITKGSNGTIVLEGSYEGRTVAVKRLVLADHDVASQEIESLIASDRGPNIVRLYGTERDQDFVYLALERCACSLDDLIQAHAKSSEKSVFPRDLASNAMQLDLFEGTMQDVDLWREDGHPSPLLLRLMRDVVSGLVHLHRSGIIHRDIKPQNVLITKELCVKLSNMGISRLLPEDTSSKYHVTECSRSGLQGSEQLGPAQHSSSIDSFGLGCVLFFCITGGRHPFGDSPKGDGNIEENTMDLSPLEFMPEAADLLACLLNPDPNLRPKALEVLHHPLFWNSKTRLSFLRDVSDWLKSKAWGTDSDLPEKMESIAQHVFDEEWNKRIDCQFMKHMRIFRAYEFKKVGDLLRIVRNTFSHYRDLPPEIQEVVGSSPEDLDSYFAKSFPRLLIETYRFVSMYCEDKEPSPFPEYLNW